MSAAELREWAIAIVVISSLALLIGFWAWRVQQDDFWGVPIVTERAVV